MFKIFSSSELPAVDEAFAARRPVLDGLKSRLLRITKNATMKYLTTTIAAALLMGCGGSEEPIPQTDTKPTEPDTDVAKSEPPTAQGIDYWGKYNFFSIDRRGFNFRVKT